MEGFHKPQAIGHRAIKVVPSSDCMVGFSNTGIDRTVFVCSKALRKKLIVDLIIYQFQKILTK